MKAIYLVLTLFLRSEVLFAQQSNLASGTIKGVITDVLSNQPLPGVTVKIQNSTKGAITDSAGMFSIAELSPGYYNVVFSSLGYKTNSVFDVQVTNARAAFLNVGLETEASRLAEVIVGRPAFIKPVESPLSLRTIGSTEIKRNPGGNRDISKVIQSLPGVSAQVSFRNDIIIRGGAPNENKFYLDGVEIPNINHFATQGSSGGPVGMINVDFIREVNFYSGAFPANRGNTLSSVFEFNQRDGRSDKLGGSLTLGATDLAASLDGPLGSKTTFISSYRYSYLQGLFTLLKLPFLPTYQDFQFKLKTRLNPKNEFTVLGLGAIDRFKLNFKTDPTEENLNRLATIPISSQDNYTIGATYKNYRSKGNSIIVLSRNYLNNGAYKFQDNDASRLKTIDYSSQETENKLRFENTSREGSVMINFGGGVETAEYKTNTLNVLPFGTINYNSKLDLVKYGVFGQVSSPFLNDKLQLSFGLRADGNTFSDRMGNPLKTLSPRASASYNVTEKFSINLNSGIYYQLPAYTVLGYRESGALVNKHVDYIQSKQLVMGLEYNTSRNSRFTVEGFYKGYNKYPMIKVLGDSVPLANLGADFGVVGNSPVVGFTEGRSYGIEFLAQQRLNKNYYGILAVTAFRSEFVDKKGSYVPSAWNSRYIVSATGGKIFPKNWELGARFRYTGGSPYTPYNIPVSSLKSNFSVYPQGIPNYNRLNSESLGDFYQLDMRVDKKYPFRKFSLNLYFDVQNITYNKYQMQSSLVLDRDASGQPQDDPFDATRYKTKLLNDESGNVLPTLGIIFEF
ncbi:MAG: TonB-dependent receptor [Sphingobacteriaceae bacterium]|nr:TonB-dependent receptor [Sphingobacteriaceae bacterium]